GRGPRVAPRRPRAARTDLPAATVGLRARVGRLALADESAAAARAARAAAGLAPAWAGARRGRPHVARAPARHGAARSLPGARVPGRALFDSPAAARRHRAGRGVRHGT